MSDEAGIEPLAAGTVHVWYAELGLLDAYWRELAATLAPGERERAARLRHEPHRRSFVASRGLLRVILGAYLDWDPSRISFACGAAGKPHLAGAPSNLAFNLSHSDELVAYAVAMDREVGIDVERLRPVPEMLAIAAFCFLAQERRFLTQLDEAERVNAFFRAWTRKEAWLKATGRGLPLGPRCVEVTMAAGEPARLLRITGIADAPRHWSLHDLRLRPGYAAALAGPDPIRPCLCRAWSWCGNPLPGLSSSPARPRFAWKFET